MFPSRAEVFGAEVGTGFEATGGEDYSFGVDGFCGGVMGYGDGGEGAGGGVEVKLLQGSGVVDLDAVMDGGGVVILHEAFASILGFESEATPEFVATVDFVRLSVERELESYALLC